ncbi:hypothetical protein SKAU_G00024740 [Synaphobranchus kaupii]|uniref:Uncharacterized protein n=1 Tax=Synaphobranchus kaupii TaxID=118154 RepID=A0A9Q1GDR9_SYNKA|nr:hypothetical protein SKAU_G00024740 [Synaphobranchus kaupii]
MSLGISLQLPFAQAVPSVIIPDASQINFHQSEGAPRHCSKNTSPGLVDQVQQILLAKAQLQRENFQGLLVAIRRGVAS